MLGIPCPDKLNLRLTSSSRTVITPSDTPMFTYTCSLIICNTSLVKFHVLVTCCPLYNSKLTDEQFTQSLYMYNYTSVRFQRSYSIHQLMHYTITCEDDFWEKMYLQMTSGRQDLPAHLRSRITVYTVHFHWNTELPLRRMYEIYLYCISEG